LFLRIFFLKNIFEEEKKFFFRKKGRSCNVLGESGKKIEELQTGGGCLFLSNLRREKSLSGRWGID